MNREHLPTHESGSSGRDWSAMLDLYVDGLLSPEDAAAFEARLRVDAGLRASLDLQRAIDSSVREQFAVPAAGGAVATAGERGGATVGRGRSIIARIGWMRLAALVTIMTLGAVVIGMRIWASGAYPTESPVVAYRAIVDRGFKPYEVCTDDAEFSSYTRRYLGTALAVDAFPGLTLVGWDNSHHVMSIETDSLLVTVDGTPIVVFMDRSENSRSLPRRGDGLNVFRRRVAGIDLVEVTPLDVAKILPKFSESAADCENGKPQPAP